MAALSSLPEWAYGVLAIGVFVLFAMYRKWRIKKRRKNRLPGSGSGGGSRPGDPPRHRR